MILTVRCETFTFGAFDAKVCGESEQIGVDLENVPIFNSFVWNYALVYLTRGTVLIRESQIYSV